MFYFRVSSYPIIWPSEFLNKETSEVWWHTPSVTALSRQISRSSRLASLVHKESPGQPGLLHKETLSLKTKTNEQTKKPDQSHDNLCS